jgi:hypothetical protein
MRNVFGWSLPPGCTQRDIDEAYGAFPPITVLGEHKHVARRRQHVCSECFGIIHLGERYDKIVYKDDDTGKISQYKVHVECPYDEEEWP